MFTDAGDPKSTSEASRRDHEMKTNSAGNGNTEQSSAGTTRTGKRGREKTPGETATTFEREDDQTADAQTIKTTHTEPTAAREAETNNHGLFRCYRMRLQPTPRQSRELQNLMHAGRWAQSSASGPTNGFLCKRGNPLEILASRTLAGHTIRW